MTSCDQAILGVYMFRKLPGGFIWLQDTLQGLNVEFVALKNYIEGVKGIGDGHCGFDLIHKTGHGWRYPRIDFHSAITRYPTGLEGEFGLLFFIGQKPGQIQSQFGLDRS